MISSDKNKSDFNFAYFILAIGIGNALEWFDFSIFGGLADIIGFHFFPAHHEGSALLDSFGVYCTSFFMRPLGGILMGYIGDRYGRKYALIISVLMMIIPSFLIGCLPTFASWGIVSTILLLILRLIQGVAVGGEMVGSLIFTVEASEGVNRGLWGSVCMASAMGGIALGSTYIAILRESMSQELLYKWGWRLPFLTSVILGVIALYLRMNIPESNEFHVAKRGDEKEESILAVFSRKRFDIILYMFAAAFWTSGYNICFVWMGYYTSNLIPGEPVQHSWILNILSTVLLVILLPISGMIGDRVYKYFGNNDNGYSFVMLVGAAIAAIFAAPAFILINLKDRLAVFAGQAILAASLALFGANLPVFLVSKFDIESRYLAVGICYNLASAFFGGTSPLAQTAWIIYLDSPNRDFSNIFVSTMPCIFLVFWALMAMIVISYSIQASNEPLQELSKGYSIDDSSRSIDTSSTPIVKSFHHSDDGSWQNIPPKSKKSISIFNISLNQSDHDSNNNSSSHGHRSHPSNGHV